MLRSIVENLKKLPSGAFSTILATVLITEFTTMYDVWHAYSVHQRTALALHLFRSTLSDAQTPYDIEKVFSQHKGTPGDTFINSAQMLCEDNDFSEMLTVVGTPENVYSVCRMVDRRINRQQGY